MGADYPIQRLRLFHGRAHHILRLHAPSIVGKTGHPGRHGLHIRKLPAHFAAGYGSVRNHLYTGVPADYIQLRPERFHIGWHRIQVRHGANCGIASAGCRQRACAYGFLIRKTRLAEMHMHIHKTGKNIKPFKRRGIGKIIPAGGIEGKIPGNKAAVVIHHCVFDDAIHGRQHSFAIANAQKTPLPSAGALYAKPQTHSAPTSSYQRLAGLTVPS